MWRDSRYRIRGQAALQPAVHAVQEMPQEDVFRGDRGIGLELEDPVPVLLLTALEGLARVEDYVLERKVVVAWGKHGHGG